MTKKLTLNEAWDRFMEMWLWIAERIRENPCLSIESLKRRWAREHNVQIVNHCYFCDYAVRHAPLESSDCDYCPGALVDPEFRCNREDYCYSSKPLAFVAKLQELNERRKVRI